MRTRIEAPRKVLVRVAPVGRAGGTLSGPRIPEGHVGENVQPRGRSGRTTAWDISYRGRRLVDFENRRTILSRDSDYAICSVSKWTHLSLVIFIYK
jgi:hypothetical protein